eukprot:TRINITY_DN1529_c0_g1_i1.p1 TRINITY_DN1529_c0_g1~~TRINITY_DN1529_c0_g1_i1.p1  ORF type:complete len:311 (+),score=13.71 TRINITY_DN1529_c0_g1_i1:70-1002(+)
MKQFLTILAMVIPLQAACTFKYTNKAASPVTICLRFNGGAPGEGGNKTIQPGGSWELPCRESIPGQSWESYLAVPGWTQCGWDQGCTPNYGSCQHYPWVIGQGVGTNGLWYGSIGANWDGAGAGFTGDFSQVTYGMNFQCTSYNKTQFPNLNCSVSGDKPICTPDKPNYNQPNSGVVECDPDQTLQLLITSSAPRPTCGTDGFCCPSCGMCMYPTKLSCFGNASACDADPSTTCCDLTKLCSKPSNTVCKPSAQCPSMSYCNPATKRCIAPQPGETCATNGDCISTDGSNYCEESLGLCVKPGPPCTVTL